MVWRGHGSASWALADDFQVLLANPQRLTAPQPVLASAARVCDLLWRPALLPSSEISVLSSLIVVVLGSATVVGSEDPSRAARTRGPRALADPVFGGWLPKLLPVGDEAYALELTSLRSSPGGAAPTATLTARTTAGALNGLETFAQLFAEASPVLRAPPDLGHNRSRGSSAGLGRRTSSAAAPPSEAAASWPSSGGGVVAAGVRSLVIEDVPSVAWRGLMVDVARHYLPLPLLVATLDAMRAVKLNVLHMHLTDAQSFPLLLQDSAPGAAAGDAAGAAAAPGAFSAAGSLFPTHGHDPGHDPGPHDVSVSVKELGRLGAFPQLPLRSHRPGGAPVDEGIVYGYTAADLAALVREASLRGIRVVPEVDVPAHTLSWGDAYPDMVVACAHQTAAAQSPSDVPALDPSRELTYQVVFAVLEAVAKVFPDEYLHLGADEVSLCMAAAVVGLQLGRVRSAGPVAWPPRPIPHGCAAAALFVARAWDCACGPRCGCRAGKRTQP